MIDCEAIKNDCCNNIEFAIKQKTLAKKVSLSGIGLHSGKNTIINIYPEDADKGIIISDGINMIPAFAEYVVDVSRGTTIGNSDVSFKTIEHLMSALHGMGIDNALVEILGPETPALDGSSLPYVEAIKSVGTIDLDKPKKTYKLPKPIFITKNDAFIIAVPSDRLRVTYLMDYDHPLIGTQKYSYEVNESNYAETIAPARTFVLYEEVAGLLENHLAKGGDLNNVIVLWQDKISCSLRYDNELIRHKILDFVGDVALAGIGLKADVLAVKSGHALNTMFALEIRNNIK